MLTKILFLFLFLLANTALAGPLTWALPTWLPSLNVSGNVGIGTTGPTHMLDVIQSGATAGIRVSGGTNPQMRVEGTTAYAKLQVCDSCSGGLNDVGNGIGLFGTENAYPFAIYTYNNERVRITSTGNVGIGTTSPNATLEVNGPSLFDSGVTIASIEYLNSEKTPISGTAGAITWTEPYQGNSDKRVYVQLNGYTNASPTTIVFTQAFTSTPALTANTTGLGTPTATASQIIISAATLVTGWFIYEGF